MRVNLIRIVLFAGVLLGLTVSALAQQPGPCTANSAIGEWGFTFNGTVFPGMACQATFAGVAKVVVQKGGHFTGSETSSTNGITGHETFDGTMTVNPDCTGTVLGNVYDESGNLARKVQWDVILVKNAQELFAIFSNLMSEPGDYVVPTNITGHSKKVGSVQNSQ